MSIRDYYHFHKDCMYYPACTETIKYKGKVKYVKFKCPMLKYSQLYNARDIHGIKWECIKFKPRQVEIEEEFYEEEQ